VRLVVGRIARAHGVHGEVSVEVRTDDAERRFANGSVLDTDPAQAGPLTVVSARPHSGRLLVKFEAVDSREAAGNLRGVHLVVDSSSSAALDDPDDFWDHDLIGLAARDTAGAPLGEVADVLHASGSQLLVVRRPDGGELLVPFVAAVVAKVDVSAGFLVVDPPDGLLEL
jgi:16S rRNA processing protein RimM